jgi:hypothetical protein
MASLTLESNQAAISVPCDGLDDAMVKAKTILDNGSGLGITRLVLLDAHGKSLGWFQRGAE